MDDADPELPPELLAEFDEACEDYCNTYERCGRTDACSCMSNIEDRHPLCVEKAIAKLECRASTSCERLFQWQELPQQDRPCFGEGVAETEACRPQ